MFDDTKPQVFEEKNLIPYLYNLSYYYSIMKIE